MFIFNNYDNDNNYDNTYEYNLLKSKKLKIKNRISFLSI